MSIKGEVVGRDAVLARIGGWDKGVRAAVVAEVTKLAIELQRRVIGKLSGEVLKNRTGTLRRSINYVVQEESGGIVGEVGTNVAYGRAHEYGFNGVVSVRAHIRRSRAQMAEARYSYRNKRGDLITKVRNTGKFGKRTGEIMVREHSREMNVPERSYLRSALADMGDVVSARILAAARGGVKK